MFGCGWHFGNTLNNYQVGSCKTQQLATSVSRRRLSGPQSFANKASQLPTPNTFSRTGFEKSFIFLSFLRMAFISPVADSFTSHRPELLLYRCNSPRLKVSQLGMTEQQGTQTANSHHQIRYPGRAIEGGSLLQIRQGDLSFPVEWGHMPQDALGKGLVKDLFWWFFHQMQNKLQRHASPRLNPVVPHEAVEAQTQRRSFQVQSRDAFLGLPFWVGFLF